MKKGWVLIGVMLLCSLIVHAEDQVENYNTYESLQLLFSLQSGVDFVGTDTVKKIEMFQADVSFFPKDNGYIKVNKLTTSADPQAEIENKEDISFKWKNPPPTRLEYHIDAEVTTYNKLRSINKKIPFPIRSLDESLLEYTKPTENIDLTPEIEKQARAVIGGEDDLYVAVFNLAEWTKRNVEYNLSTLTAEVVQKSSWVLKNKEGVCDELTNLFISFLRSAGIPARFVSGMVYSNLDYQWGPHGWAEVYFPDMGWMPFDVTFGQYGWIDPSHIKLKESLDSGSPSAEYTWRATGVEAKMRDIKVTATLKEKQGESISPLNLQIQPLYPEAKFGSYVPLLVTVENVLDSYVSTSVAIKKAPGLTEKNVKEILLKPKETKTVVWIIELPEGDGNYLYTGALEAETSFGNTANAKIHYGAGFKSYGRNEAENYLAKSIQREEKKQLEGLRMSCIPDQEIYYSNDTAKITCKIINTREKSLDLDICIQDACQQKTLLAEQDATLLFEIKARANGRIPVIAENKEGVAYTNVEVSTISLPDIYITDVTPEVIDYSDQVILHFNLNSDTAVHDVNINFGFDNFKVKEFKGTREITIEASGKNLRHGLTFTVSFLDEKEKAYNLEKAVYLQVNNIPFYAKIIDWFTKLLGITQ